MKSMVDNSKDSFFLPLARRLPLWITPNSLTVTRFLLVIPIAYFAFQKNEEVLLFLFLLGFFLDALDGTLARLRHQVTLFGKLSDPLADKLILVPIFLALAIGKISFPVIAAVTIMELTVMLFPFLWIPILHFLRMPFPDSANTFGKVKTFLEIVAIIFIFAGRIDPVFFRVSEWLLVAAVLGGGASIVRHLVEFSRKKWI